MKPYAIAEVWAELVDVVVAAVLGFVAVVVAAVLGWFSKHFWDKSRRRR